MIVSQKPIVFMYLFSFNRLFILCLIVFLWSQVTSISAQQQFNYDELSLSSYQDSLLLENHEDYFAFNLNRDSLNTYFKSIDTVLNITLNFRNFATWEFDIEEKKIRGDSFTLSVISDSGRSILPTPPCNSYKGKLVDSTNYIAKFYISNKITWGKIRDVDTIYRIRPLSDFDTSASESIFVLTKSLSLVESNSSENCAEPYIEFALVVGYPFYLDASGEGMTEQDICNLVEFTTYQGMDLYNDEFNLGFLIQDCEIWESPDNFCCSTQDFRVKINGSYSLRKYCLYPYIDVFALFYDKSFPHLGLATSSDLCGDVKPAMIVQEEPDYNESRMTFVFAHEIGHILGSPELEDLSCPESSYCLSPPFGLEAPLMCSNGFTSDVNDFSPNMWITNCTRDIITPTIEDNCNICLDEYQDAPDCPGCGFSGELTAEYQQPLFYPCSEEDEITYTFEVCNNYCETKSADIHVTLDEDQQEILSLDPAFGTPIPLVNTTKIPLKSSFETFDEGQCKTFTYTTKVIGDNGGGIVGNAFRIEENGNVVLDDLHLTVTEGIQIGSAGTTTSLNTLVNSSVLPDVTPPCSGNTPNLILDIEGTLEIDRDYCFSDNWIIKMAPGSEIVVLDGYHLNITSCTLSSCDKMWKGITVEDNAALTSWYNSI